MARGNITICTTLINCLAHDYGSTGNERGTRADGFHASSIGKGCQFVAVPT